MRQIIEGIAYDTDTATQVIGGDNGHWSSAWWGLYRTQDGVFFKIVVGHDGATLQECRTLTAGAARAELERHANHLVEKYFGPMPEPSSARFTRRTVLGAIDVLESQFSQASITSFLTDLGPSVYNEVRAEKISAKKRLNDLKQFVDTYPAHPVEGGLLEEVIVEKAASLLAARESQIYSWSDSTLPAPMDQFKRVLEQDGFVVTDGALRRTLPADVGLPQTESELMRLLHRHSFDTAKGHLEQAFDNHAQGNWAAANSQLRTFFDALLDEIAERIDPSVKALGSGQPRRAKLAALGFLSVPLNEWADDGKGFINGLVKRLHPQGAHPGLSDDEDCTFRLHVILLTAALLLQRFDQGARP